MRSAFGEALLRQVEALEAPERDAIVGRLAEETREHYRRAKAIGWSPMTLHMDVSDCIRAVLGSARNIDLWRETMADLTRRPMLSGFFVTSARGSASGRARSTDRTRGFGSTSAATSDT